MQIITKAGVDINNFATEHPDAKGSLQTWVKRVESHIWKTPMDVKNCYPKASIVSNNRIVFDVRGGHYRILTRIDYSRSVVQVRFIGTHREYDRIDAATY